MSATLSGLIILENPRPVDGLPSSIIFDGQMWLAPGRILTGEFRYYNSTNEFFSKVGKYFAWIHVAKFSPVGLTLHANKEDDAIPESEQELKEWQNVEDIVKTDDSVTSETLEDTSDVLHVVGDIV